MATLTKYDIQGKKKGELELSNDWLEVQAHSQLIKDYIVAIRENARQWSANTKTRAEVKHTTKKPHPQKGTGGARHGNLVTAQFRGGGIVFGPKPKFDQHVDINKKEKRKAIKSLISEKIRENKVFILDSSEMSEPRTKSVAKFLEALQINGRVLFLGEGSHQTIETEGKKTAVSVKTKQHENFAKSIRNLPKTAFSLAKNINGYDLAIAGSLVMTESAFNEVNEWLA